MARDLPLNAYPATWVEAAILHGTKSAIVFFRDRNSRDKGWKEVDPAGNDLAIKELDGDKEYAVIRINPSAPESRK